MEIVARLENAESMLTSILKPSTNLRNPIVAKEDTPRSVIAKAISECKIFLAVNQDKAEWESYEIASNLAYAIDGALEEGIKVPKADIEELCETISLLKERVIDYEAETSDEPVTKAPTKSSILAARKEANKKLRDASSVLGLKALAHVNMDLLVDIEVLPRKATSKKEVVANIDILRSKYGVDDKDLNRMSSQLDNIHPYLERSRANLPMKATDRFVLIKQPIIIAGSKKYTPSSKAGRWLATNGYLVGDYWVLKDQWILATATNLEAVVKTPEYRKQVRLRITKSMKDEHENWLQSLSKSAKISQRDIKLRYDKMLQDIDSEVEEELKNLARPISIDTITKGLSIKVGETLIVMDGLDKYSGSPYTFRWLCEEDIYRDVVLGAYSDITGWSLPYKK